MASPALTPVDFDPFQAEGEDPAAAAARYEAHLLELHHAQQQSSHATSGDASGEPTYLQGVGQRALQVGGERINRLINTLRAPGDVLTGARPMTPDEVQQAGASLAGLVSAGGFGRAALAGEVPANDLLGIIAGKSAKTADLAALAERDRIAGFDPRNVGAWRSTGWYIGAEGLPRFEISDQPAGIMPEGVQDLRGLGAKVKLGDLWNHPELYAAYPHLKDLPVELRAPRMNELASFKSDENKIIVTPDGLRDPEFESTLAHEVQHAVQYAEGFAKGGNPVSYFHPVVANRAEALFQQLGAYRGLKLEEIPPAERDWVRNARQTLHDYNQLMIMKGPEKYRLSAGENEANAVMNRLGMSPAQLKLVPPWKTEVPIGEQDVVPPVTPAGYRRGKGGFGPAEPIPLEELIGGGGKGPAEPADIAKSTAAALKTPSAATSPPPSAIQSIISSAKSVPWTVDRSHDVPYGAGASTAEGKTYVDRRIPSKMTVGGKSFDPAEFLSIHEQVEHRLMQHGLSYEEAHRFATAQERAGVEAKGVNWRKYEKAMERYLDVTESERDDTRMPTDLYTKPYSHSDLRKFKGKAPPDVH